MNRRGFVRTALAGVGGLFFSRKLEAYGGAMKLSDIPKSNIEIPIAPLRGSIRQETKDIRQGRHPDIVGEMARITGYVSEYIIATGRRRKLTSALVSAHNAKVCLHLDPWSTKVAGLGPTWIDINDTSAIRARIGEVKEWLTQWNRFIHPSHINIYDESIKLTEENSDAILRRNVELWLAISETCSDAEIAWYNNCFIRQRDIYPFVHHKTPGPSQASLYHWDNFVNAYQLATTVRFGSPFNIPVIANVELHRKKRPKGGYDPLGIDVNRYREQGEIIISSGCSKVIISEYPIVKNGVENSDMVANLAALIDGLATGK